MLWAQNFELQDSLKNPCSNFAQPGEDRSSMCNFDFVPTEFIPFLFYIYIMACILVAKHEGALRGEGFCPTDICDNCNNTYNLICVQK